MKTLLLIAPMGKAGLVGKDISFRFPALGLLRIASVTPSGWNVQIVDEKVETLDSEVEADLVGITAMTVTAPRAYEIADHFRSRGIQVAMGGMHVSAMPSEGLRHCDSVVVGEGEALWPSVLSDFDRGEMKSIYRDQAGAFEVGGLPRIDWSLCRSKGYLPVHFIETTRGCPLDCEFCAVTNAFGGRFRNRPLEDVLTELRGLEPFQGAFTLKNCIFFVDDNIISNRAYAREFLSRIIDYKLKWFGQASMNLAFDSEILRLCKQSGCMGLFIGFESLSAETLRSIGHKPNHPDRYLEAVQRIHEHGIGIDASFVFGFDTDDEAVFDRTLEFITRAKVEVTYFSILTPYPGTRLFKRLEGERRLLTSDWGQYDTSHVVFRPRRLTPGQLQAGYFGALKEAYSLSSIFARMWGTSSYKNFFWPMNLGFRRAAKALYRSYRGGLMQTRPSEETPF